MQVVTDGGRYLCMVIPTIKRRKYEQLLGNHNVQLMQLCKSKIFALIMTAQTGINSPPSPSKRG